jgi:hypothetical protein
MSSLAKVVWVDPLKGFPGCADRYLPLVVNRYDILISIGSLHKTAIFPTADPSFDSVLVTQSPIG